MNLDLFADLPEPVQSAPIAAAPSDDGWNPEMMAAWRSKQPAPVVVATTRQDNRATGGLTMFVEPVNVRAGEELTIIQAADYPMQPCGRNRWTYKGQIITYDAHQLAVPGRGRWANVEGIGYPAVRANSHSEICAVIDARSTQ